MSKIWISSDFHLNHNKPFIYEDRGFRNIQDHDIAVIERFNAVVNDDDTVYLLGDIALGTDYIYIERCLQKLKGKIYIIVGNHDTPAKIAFYNAVGFTVLGYGAVINFHKYHFYLSHYPTITANYDCISPLKHKTINLCGHRHTKDRFADIKTGWIYHCEVDAHYLYPVLLDNIITDLQGQHYQERMLLAINP